MTRMTIDIVPIAEEHAAGLHACLDAVAREKLVHARRQGLVRIELQVRIDKLAAIRLHERVGFSHEGRKRN